VIASLHDETVRLSRLVADLETLASADAATFTLDRRPTSLNALIRDLTSGLAERFTEAGLDLRTDLAQVTVDGDPDDCARSGRTCSPTRASSWASGGTVTVTLRDDGDWAELQVTDTGPGIGPDDLPRVFRALLPQPHSPCRRFGHRAPVVAELVAAHGAMSPWTANSATENTFRVTTAYVHAPVPQTPVSGTGVSTARRDQ